jgi:LacI family transcriptional regulator
LSATIKDVARVAGCSIKTVSRVINNEPYVTDETRARVQAAIRTVGYAPNISARRLVQQKSFMICLLMYPGFSQPASNVLTRIMDIGYEESYDILVHPYYPTLPRSRNRLVDVIYEHRYDGFVTTPPCEADNFVADLLGTYKIPLVEVSPLNRSNKIPYVAGDDYQGAFAITEHLIKLGHRRIGFLTGPRNMRSSFDRLYGFRAALDAHQVPHLAELVRDTEFTFDGGYTAARMLLEERQRPSAIFSGNDEAAYGAIFAAQELGVKVPDQLSVCGYDDLLFSKHIWPGLTTVHQPADAMIEKAIRLLIDILKGNNPQETQVTLPYRLVIRGSTGQTPDE